MAPSAAAPIKPVRVFTTYPSEDASRRLRIDPLVEALRQEGRAVTVNTLLTSAMFESKNAKGWRRLQVGAKLLGRLTIRCSELAAVRGSDVVVVHREAFPFFTPIAERWLAWRAAAIVLDIDDALYAEPTHGRDWRRWLRSRRAYDSVLGCVDLALAGSPALCGRAAELGTEATLAYTVPPADARSLRRAPSRRPTVVWTGSQSTLGSLREVIDDVLAVCDEVDARLVVLGGANVLDLPRHPRLTAERWSQQRELEALEAAWLGLMPLPDNEWEAGKSSYKLLLYLFAGLPVVASSVGMNRIFAEAPGVTLVDETGGWREALRIALSGTDPGVGEQCRAWVQALVRPEEQLSRTAKLIRRLSRDS